jgi:hypothetical protein
MSPPRSMRPCFDLFFFVSIFGNRWCSLVYLLMARSACGYCAVNSVLWAESCQYELWHLLAAHLAEKLEFNQFAAHANATV